MHIRTKLLILFLAFIIIPAAFISALNLSNASSYLSGAQLAEMGRLTVFLIIVTALLGAFVAISVSKSISDPIHALHKGTEIIGSGNLDYKVGTPANDEIGQLSRAFDQMTDNLKRLEEETQMKGMLLDAAADSIIVHDLEGKIIYANQKAGELRGYAVKELLGKNIHNLVVPERVRLIDNRIKDLKTNSEVKFESIHMRKDGTNFPIEVNARLVDWQGQKLVLRVGRDITERKRAEEKELELAKTRELDRLKSMFIASMSHELRTPLNSIIGFTGILLMGMAGELNEEQKKQLAMVKSSAGHLLTLINDVIDVSKIEAEKIQLTIEEFDLSCVVKEVLDSFAVAVEEKALKLRAEMPDKAVVKSDERRTKQIIMNLVSNAIKFTEKGEIGIRVEGSGAWVSITVKDSGIGIKETDMPKLFKQFSRIMVEGQPLQEGTGLGLYLSQKLARVLGGEIKAASEFGKGSEFTLTLPLEYKGG